MTGKVKDTRRKFTPRRKIWKLQSSSVISDFSSYIDKYRESSKKDASVERYWNLLIGALLEVRDRTCGLTKSSARHRETWWRNDVRASELIVTKKRKL